MKNFLSLVLVLMALYTQSQNNPIFIDGLTNEWQEEYSSKYIDSDNDGEQIELLTLRITNDENFLYISFTLQNELLLNNYNSLELFIDSDDNSSTGNAVGNIGAELYWKFGDRHGFFYKGKDQTKIYHNNISYTSLPTVTSTNFELTIALDAIPDGENQLFTAEKICVLLKDANGDQIPNAGEKFEYTINSSLNNSFEPLDISRDKQTDFRLMTYNVLHEGITDPERKEYFTRIFRAVEPDIITLNECWDVTAKEAKEVLDEALPLDNNEGWITVKRDGSSITCSRFEIIQSWNVNPGRRMTATLINIPDNRSDRDILIFNGHLKCCDADDIRQREVDRLVNFIIDAQTEGGEIDIPENTPFLLAGDLNLVGNRQQLQTITHGEIINTLTYGNGRLLDWDNTPLQDVISSHTDEPTAITWRNNRSSYWPGRLDFTIISNSALEARNAFTIQTEKMSSERLAEFGLHAEDTKEASDHLPKITDFKIIESSSIRDIESKIHIYPNPAKTILHIDHNGFDISDIVFIDAQSGKKIPAIIISENRANNTVLDIKKLPRGLYIIEIKVDNDYTVYKKVIIEGVK
ncbi:MAG: T9SS type A sorting domain-containing protein [Bacteroidota bacterium]|nr:T9SS type A sorting domain-containing protein [Bacteroidota bacterium]